MNKLKEDPVPSQDTNPDWNELGYISWKEFKKMAPPIIKLEINRTSKLLKGLDSGSDIYNALIKARYNLTQFVQCLEQAKTPPLPNSCTDHLSKAILNLSLGDSGDTSKTIHYILDRLNYAYNRIGMIY